MQGRGGLVADIPKARGGLADDGLGLRGNVGPVVQRMRNGGDGIAGFTRDILERDGFFGMAGNGHTGTSQSMV